MPPGFGDGKPPPTSHQELPEDPIETESEAGLKGTIKTVSARAIVVYPSTNTARINYSPPVHTHDDPRNPSLRPLSHTRRYTVTMMLLWVCKADRLYRSDGAEEIPLPFPKFDMGMPNTRTHDILVLSTDPRFRCQRLTRRCRVVTPNPLADYTLQRPTRPMPT